MISVVLLVTGACSLGRSEAVTDESEVAAAERLCPVMWEWVKNVGASFNSASGDVASIEGPEERRARWNRAFDEMAELNAKLEDDLTEMRDDPILDPIVAEILRDLPLSTAEIDDIRAFIRETPEMDEQRHQERTQQVIVRIEKVISLPKPSMSGLDTTGTLIPAFRQVPSCQHALNDIDDGTPRANG